MVFLTEFEQNSNRNMKLYHQKDNKETSTQADCQNASYVWTLSDLFFSKWRERTMRQSNSKAISMVVFVTCMRPISHRVGRLVGRSVGWSITLFAFLGILRVGKFVFEHPCPNHYCPCPTTRDRSSHVYGLVFFYFLMYCFIFFRFFTTNEQLNQI